MNERKLIACIRLSNFLSFGVCAFNFCENIFILIFFSERKIVTLEPKPKPKSKLKAFCRLWVTYQHIFPWKLESRISRPSFSDRCSLYFIISFVVDVLLKMFPSAVAFQAIWQYKIASLLSFQSPVLFFFSSGGQNIGNIVQTNELQLIMYTTYDNHLIYHFEGLISFDLLLIKLWWHVSCNNNNKIREDCAVL